MIGQPTPADQPTSELEEKVLPLLKANRKIEAIKVYREATGRSLYDSKEAVEEIAHRHRVMPIQAGCLSVLLWAALPWAALWLLSLCRA